MKAPTFWGSKNLLSTALLPVATWYDMAATLTRAFITPVTLPVPVICIGNATAGGAGKTPVALAIGQRLKAKNIAAFFLSRGYGGSAAGPLRVDPAKHSAREVGDEPLLLARLLPTIVAKDRVAGARLALKQGAKAIIMDDGFQNPSLTKTLSLLVIDGKTGIGNGRLMPAGPLRESWKNALSRTHALVVVGPAERVPPVPEEKVIFRARVQPDSLRVKGAKILPFCGIAHPQKFFSMLTSLGAQLEETVSFPDHYLYKPSDMKKLAVRAAKLKAALVTTAKDAVRIPATYRDCVAVMEMSLAFDDEVLLDAVLEAIVYGKA